MVPIGWTSTAVIMAKRFLSSLITISILYVEIAKFIGLDLKIVGFPGHILVKYNEEMILDPFYDGRLLDIDDLQEVLDANFDGELEFKPEFLDEVKDEIEISNNIFLNIVWYCLGNAPF